MKKNILIGVSGGIAAYKILDVVSRLKKLDFNVNVIMTKNACEFVTPLTFQTISKNLVVTDTFERVNSWEVEHISLAKKADLVLIAPATANIIGKIANGIADDMLSTTVMATKCPVIISPAMNTAMYENPIVKDNINYLKSKGYSFINPDKGMLACGDIGSGILPTPEIIVSHITNFFNKKPDLIGKKVLITAGPTVEEIDPMRYITNHSSGKMGYAIAKNAYERGAIVTLVSGPTNLDCPYGVHKIDVRSALQMHDEVHKYFKDTDIVIKAAAVADYRPEIKSQSKIKKDGNSLTITLTPNKDILKSLGEIKTNQILVGFAAETNNILEYAKEKIKSKNLDFIVANNIAQTGAGFKSDTNIATIIDKNGNENLYPLMKKDELSSIILDNVVDIILKKESF